MAAPGNRGRRAFAVHTGTMTIRVGRRPGRPTGGRHVVDRAVVLDAAERVIRRDGAGVSLEAIALEAGVTKPIVYARVGGRADVANALAERLADRLIAAARTAVDGRPYGHEMLASLIEANLVTVAAHRELFLYVTGGTSDESPMRTLYLAERSTAPLGTAARSVAHPQWARPGCRRALGVCRGGDAATRVAVVGHRARSPGGPVGRSSRRTALDGPFDHVR